MVNVGAAFIFVGIIFYAFVSGRKNPSQSQTRPADSEKKDSLAILQRYLRDPTLPDAIDIMENQLPSLVWVDWREDDTDIVKNTARCLQTGELSAESQPCGFLEILFRRKATVIAYPQGIADRNITLTTLNRILSPEYQIRFCESSLGSDTLGFVVLASRCWQKLEKEFGATLVRQHFSELYEGRKLF